MTGMLMLGKMSVCIVTIDSNPITAMSRATTTKVYGRRSASRTIHICGSCQLCSRHFRHVRDLADFPFGQSQAGGGHGLLDLLGVAAADDRPGDRRMPEHPGNRDLARRPPGPFAHRPQTP